jgi:hypothetical protein
MRNLDSCYCWRCTLYPCKVKNKFLVNFWNSAILLCIPCVCVCIYIIILCITRRAILIIRVLLTSLAVQKEGCACSDGGRYEFVTFCSTVSWVLIRKVQDCFFKNFSPSTALSLWIQKRRTFQCECAGLNKLSVTDKVVFVSCLLVLNTNTKHQAT